MLSTRASHIAKVNISRRGVIAGATAASAAVALPTWWAGSASADTPYLPPVRSYIKTPVPDEQTRHMVNRFAYGFTPALSAQVSAAGGPRAWFDRQLDPDQVSDTAAAAFSSWYPTIGRTAVQHFNIAETMNGYGYQVWSNHGRWSMLRRMYSTRQLLEVMTEFWCNHLHVYAGADLTWLWRDGYDALIRQHALGRFDEMLQAATIHESMLVYLDADLSRVERRTTRSGGTVTTEKINENLGRELLELHTVGRNAYSESDVKDSAYILTGWTIDRFDTWKLTYDPDSHYTGTVKVLGFTEANAQRDGRGVLTRYLQYLAHHRQTAERIARKLAVRFVSDMPSEQLVTDLADVFQDSGTDIKATLTALIEHPEFRASAGMKVRTPTEDVAATFRVLGAQMSRPNSNGDAANAIFYQCKSVGQVPFGWERPDGFPDNGQAWSSAARLMGSYRVHNSTAGHWYPSTGVGYRSHASWLPQPRIRFDLFVDHLCRSLHGQGATSLLLGAACLVVDATPEDMITSDHRVIKWRLPRLIGLLLDTQQHMTK
ncbi:MAG: DUF1800 domain-containing protein [Nocardioidaceae bacterium]